MYITPRLVLLPGFDGSGRYFDPLIRAIDARIDTEVLPLPDRGEQSYEALAGIASRQIEVPSFVLAESFSGPLAIMLARHAPEKVLGLILCATFFASPLPNFVLRGLRAFTPVRKIVPGLEFLLGTLLLNRHDHPLAADIANDVRNMSTEVICDRITALTKIESSRFTDSRSLPALILTATKDRLIRRSRHAKLADSTCASVNIAGPHLLLQENPQECAEHIIKFVRDAS